ncbi:hypothetical protein SEA_MARGARET_71 [Gordonia phage Margaret]|nr:hypothetical protein SEA_MARGARET_71 [Gordonia phage Margaret]
MSDHAYWPNMIAMGDCTVCGRPKSAHQPHTEQEAVDAVLREKGIDTGERIHHPRCAMPRDHGASCVIPYWTRPKPRYRVRGRYMKSGPLLWYRVQWREPDGYWVTVGTFREWRDAMNYANGLAREDMERDG